MEGWLGHGRGRPRADRGRRRRGQWQSISRRYSRRDFQICNHGYSDSGSSMATSDGGRFPDLQLRRYGRPDFEICRTMRRIKQRKTAMLGLDIARVSLIKAPVTPPLATVEEGRRSSGCGRRRRKRGLKRRFFNFSSPESMPRPNRRRNRFRIGDPLRPTITNKLRFA